MSLLFILSFSFISFLTTGIVAFNFFREEEEEEEEEVHVSLLLSSLITIPLLALCTNHLNLNSGVSKEEKIFKGWRKSHTLGGGIVVCSNKQYENSRPEILRTFMGGQLLSIL